MPSRYPWVRAVSALLGIAVVMGVLVVVAGGVRAEREANERDNRAWYTARGGDPSPAIDEGALQNVIAGYTNEYFPSVGPASIGGVLEMVGDSGYGARIQASYGDRPGSYLVRIENTGVSSFTCAFESAGAWLDAERGPRIYPPVVRKVSSGSASRTAIAPDTETDFVLAFDVPAGITPTRLLLSLQLGKHLPTAEWDMP